MLPTIRAPRLSSGVLHANAAFAQRNVRESLIQLHDAGVIDVVRVADDGHYSIRHADWATLLRLPSAPDLPFHYDWIPAYRALTRIYGWLQQPQLEELSPYLLASQARTLIDDIGGDLSYVGIPAGLHSAHGADYWDPFVSITHGDRQRAPQPLAAVMIDESRAAQLTDISRPSHAALRPGPTSEGRLRLRPPTR